MRGPAITLPAAALLVAAALCAGCPAALAPTGGDPFACVDDGECSDGYVCVDSVCVSSRSDAGIAAQDSSADSGPRTEGGVDASAPDRAVPDLGLADILVADAAGADATRPDISRADTAAADTSIQDSALPDSSLTDTSIPDTSIPDTSIPDSSGADAGSGRVTEDIFLLYTFEEGQGDVVNDVSGVGNAVDLSIGDTAATTWVSGGLEVNTGSAQTLIVSAGAPQKLYDACQQSNAITVEAWVTAAQLTDTGPGRIVTCSADTGNRNFTFGQGFSELEDVWTSRIRTDTGPDQGSNNGIPNIWTRPATTSTALTHLVFTHSDAEDLLRFYIDGVEVEVDAEGDQGNYLFGYPRSGGYSNWNGSYRIGLGGELNAAGGTRAWVGVYHLVAVYCRALSAAEVGQNFTAGPG